MQITKYILSLNLTKQGFHQIIRKLLISAFNELYSYLRLNNAYF